MRFRHLDNDIVRAARQQDFLRAGEGPDEHEQPAAQPPPARQGVREEHRPPTRTCRRAAASCGCCRLAASSAGQPVRQIRFPHTFVHTPAPTTTVTPFGDGTAAAIGLGDYVTATPEQIQRAVREFMHPPRAAPKRAAPRGTEATRGKRRARGERRDYRLVDALADAKAIVRPRSRTARFELPVYAPALAHAARPLPAAARASRRPAPLRDPRPRRPPPRGLPARGRGERDEGQYYGVQGTTWRNPPILDGTHQTARMAGRSYRVYYDGARIRLVAWHTPKGVYWVSNTLSRDLTNRQMLGIARSLTRIPAR